METVPSGGPHPSHRTRTGALRSGSQTEGSVPTAEKIVRSSSPNGGAARPERPAHHGSRQCREGTPGTNYASHRACHPTSRLMFRHPYACERAARLEVGFETRGSRSTAPPRVPGPDDRRDGDTRATGIDAWPLLAARCRGEIARSDGSVGPSTAPRSDRTASAGPHEPPSALRLDVPRETLPARSGPEQRGTREATAGSLRAQ